MITQYHKIVILSLCNSFVLDNWSGVSVWIEIIRKTAWQSYCGQTSIVFRKQRAHVVSYSLFRFIDGRPQSREPGWLTSDRAAGTSSEWQPSTPMGPEVSPHPVDTSTPAEVRQTHTLSLCVCKRMSDLVLLQQWGAKILKHANCEMKNLRKCDNLFNNRFVLGLVLQTCYIYYHSVKTTTVWIRYILLLNKKRKLKMLTILNSSSLESG